MTKNSRLNFEDVSIGDELAPLVKGPLSTTHIMRWSSAIENWHRIHYDHLFAVEHDKLPGVLINGSFKRNFLAQYLKDWAGETGWAWKLNFQFRKMNVVNETLRIWGKITDKKETRDYGLVFLELGIINEDGLESTPATGVVALPYRDGPPVTYPFVPPSE